MVIKGYRRLSHCAYNAVRKDPCPPRKTGVSERGSSAWVVLGRFEMDLVTKLIGPKSKDRNDIPYTYEARISLLDDGDAFNSYIADTICGLVKYLDDHDIDPGTVEIFEVFEHKERKLEKAYCLSSQGKWLSRTALCKSFSEYYPDHIGRTGCRFEDRNRKIAGP